jgi:hypothetical protein
MRIKAVDQIRHLAGADSRVQLALSRICADAAGANYEAWRLGRPMPTDKDGDRSSARTPVAIGRFYFASVDALRDRVRQIVASYEDEGAPLAGEDREMIEALLVEKHPDADRKIGPGLKAIEVRTNDFRKKAFFLQLIDGTGDFFGWEKKCLSPSSAIELVRSALRTSVRGQIVDARKRYFAGASTARCERSGKPITVDTCEVHHSSPTFRVIVDEYLAEKGVRPDEVDFMRENGVQGATLAAEWTWLARDFVEYHRARARFQILDSYEHRRLPRSER